MSTYPETPAPTRVDAPASGGRHPLDVGHLVMGLAFLGLVAAWALAQTGLVQGSDLRWLLPVPWLLAGTAGLAVVATRSLRGGTRTTRTTTHDPVDHPVDLLEEDAR